MPTFNRRDFLTYGAAALAAGLARPHTASAALARPQATTVRTLGKTGLECSYLGIGTGIRGVAPGITDLTWKLTGEQFVDLLQYAYAQGITYFDLADRYGSHCYMREAMRRGAKIPRDKVMLLSKVWSREPEEVKKDLERFRKELDTDVIDIVLMHCIRGGEEHWPEKLRPLMDILADAKAKGRIRAHGVSCHNLAALARVPGEPWCDVALVRINPFNSHMDGPIEAVAPIVKKMHEEGKGVLGMKILGEGDPKVVAKMDESLRYAADLGAIDAMTIGFMSRGEIDDVMGRMAAMA